MNEEEAKSYINSLLSQVMHDGREFDKNPQKYLEEQGYTDVRNIDGKWYGIQRMLFTTGLFCDLNATGNRGGRICFDTRANAAQFLKEWDGQKEPEIRDGLTADKRIIK